MINNYNASVYAGVILRRLINDNYSTQEEFALDFGCELRTVSRYINEGISKVSTIKELAIFFDIPIKDFFPE